MNDIFEFAKKMEMDGKANYLEHKEKISNPAIKRILQMLADEEQNHYDIFDAMQKGADVELEPIDLKEVKNVFQEMKDKGEGFDVSGDEVDFYEKAKEVEKNSEELYRKKAEELEDEHMKAKVNEIADEEHRHMLLMQDLIDFIRQPQQWVENAEFNHMDEY